MSKIVFILGAGASAHCRTPLIGNFLEVAQDLLRRGEVNEVKVDFENVFEAIGKLHAAQSKAIIDTYNIEDVYAAFEMGRLLGRLPGIENYDILNALTSSIRIVIGYTLERTTRLPHETKGKASAPEAYAKLARIIESLIREERECSILSFNYDLGLDYSLQRISILSDYNLGDVSVKDKRSVAFLKLHGSLNWGKCQTCGKIIPHRELKHFPTEKDYSIIPIISQLKNLYCPYCKEQHIQGPFIVPPTWNKTVYHEQIEPVWKRAAHELKDAEYIFVLGYSFPPTDMFFRYLFALGLDISTILRGFYVYDINPVVEGRFRSLLSSGISQKFYFYKLKFEHAMEKVISGYSDYMDLNTKYLTVPQILDIQDQSSSVPRIVVPRG